MDKNKVMESATKLISKGQFDKAVKEYQRVLEVDPDDVRVLQKLAELYQKMNRKAEAADCFEKVAKTYAAQGFYLKAVALYKQVLKVIDRVEVNVRLAELYQQLGLVGDATKEWQTVAGYYEKIGDTKASLDTLKKLIDLDPDNVAARIRLGEQYAREDNLIEAVAELRRAAQYLQRNGRGDDYLRVAERISHLDQNDVTLARELAESYLARGDSKRALAKLQICFKANPRDLGTLQMLARAFQELGQVSKTVSVLKELARVHADAGRGPDARRTYQQALDLAPDDQELKASLKALDAAPAVARPSPIASVPQAPPPAPRPSTAPVQAARQAAPAAPVRPQTSPIQTARPPTVPIPAVAGGPSTAAAVPKLLKETEVYIKYGLHEKALEHLRKIFSADPDNLDAHEKAKAVALASGRKDDAIASLSTLLRLASERGDPRADAARAELLELDPGNAALGGEEAPQEEEVALEMVEEDQVEVEPVASEEEGEDFVEGELAAGEEEEILVGEPEPLPARAAAPRGRKQEAPEPEEEADAFASDIAEADFYLQAGLTEDARAILEAITLASPDHPGASARLQKLGGEPPVVEDDLHAQELPEGASAELSPEHDDLARELAAELAAEVEGEPGEEGAPLTGDALAPFQVPADEVLGEFRAKLQETVRPEDVQTHYDLGIAYKEMGLIEEAVGEFELALRHGGPTRAADCTTMLGVCEMERGNAAAAIDHFSRGLALPALTAEARRALRFELGAAYESAGQGAGALEQYAAVSREDPQYRDLQARIARLGGVAQKPVAAAPGVKQARTSPPQPAQKTAAQARPAPGTPAPAQAVGTAGGAQDPDSAAARKARKIGFV